MPGRTTRTSRALILAAVLMCLVLGALVTQSSAAPSPIAGESMPDMFVAGDAGDFALTSKDTVAEEITDDSTQDSAKEAPDPQEDSGQTSDPTPTQAPPDTAKNDSSEVPQGKWTSAEGIWYYLVDGTPYRGWLHDTDGHTYYFNSQDGSMKTGWLTMGEKRYYFDMDGIMQTGDITLNGKVYRFREDGTQIGYVPKPTAAPAKKEEAKKKNSDKESSGKKVSSDTGNSRKTIALTFDDGPGSFTGRLLDCLEANNAKATFFMVGKEIESFPDEVKRMEKLGCELGNHSYNHADLTTLSAEDISWQIGTTDQLLFDLTGHGATVVRPPYGAIDDNVRATVGTPMILWSVDTLDWKTGDVQQTIDTVLSSAEDGAIILMHDIYETTVEAAETIIPELIKQGYELVTIHELAKAHKTTLDTGIAYGAMNS